MKEHKDDKEPIDVKGKWHGVCEFYYRENSQLRFKGGYVNGEAKGFHIGYWLDGSLWFKRYYP